MTQRAYAVQGDVNTGLHELRFDPLANDGCGVSVPCDKKGIVDLDGLSERMRVIYFGARAMIGREYSYPTVHPVH